MSWFKNKIRNWLQDHSEYPTDMVKSSSVYNVGSYSPSKLDSPGGINFRMYKANGGFVVESHMYDTTTDRNRSSLHIITNEQNVGQELGKIVTVECLRN
jgi:hypothetical protein